MTNAMSDYSVSDAIERSPYHRLLNLRFISQDNYTASVRLGVELREDLMRSDDGGGLHGGAIASIIDVAAFYAVRIAAGRSGVTTGLSVDYLRPVNGSNVEAEARIVKSGRTQALADIEVFDGSSLTAIGRARFALMDLT